MVGSAIVRELQANSFGNLILKTRRELDLRDPAAVHAMFAEQRPEYVFLAAAKVGGIGANVHDPAGFLHDNLLIQSNVLLAAKQGGVVKLCFLGSSCIYPRECPQPIREDSLLTGPLEPTNEGYALAKIAGLRLAQYYARQGQLKTICLMPCNLYGPNDSFDLERAHVLSSLVRRFVDAVESNASEVRLWGTGRARREFMHVDDLARACRFFMETRDVADHINVGWGVDATIAELAATVASKAGFSGRVIWDPSRPDGMPRKCMDVSQMRAAGFVPKIPLMDGIDEVIADYRRRRVHGAGVEIGGGT